MPIVSEEHKRKKKRQILIGALTCFAKKGYEVATIDDIVRYSGVSKGAIYNYFKKKEDIYVELFNLITKESFDQIIEQLKRLNSSFDKIHSLFDFYLEENPSSLNLNESTIVQLEFQLSSSRNADLMKILDGMYKKANLEIVIQVLVEGIQAGEIKKEINTEIYAEIFLSFIDGLYLQKLLFPDIPFKDVINEQKLSFIHSIKK
ncbi:TetR/AcrR family transcriptional regulator [Cytobacillus sp. FJAT-53684]|uniref:TetR/AcrR family transcriptional regulator n=1 Tax=Cytobacillus mangrovibacter TaxID=3299024 RepID=A0ABW6JZ15_9BACI